MEMKFISVGLSNIVAVHRIISIIPPDSAPVKRIIKEARKAGTLIDVTYGRKTRSVIVMDSGHIILSVIGTETIMGRIAGKEDASTRTEEEES